MDRVQCNRMKIQYIGLRNNDAVLLRVQGTQHFEIWVWNLKYNTGEKPFSCTKMVAYLYK